MMPLSPREQNLLKRHFDHAAGHQRYVSPKAQRNKYPLIRNLRNVAGIGLTTLILSTAAPQSRTAQFELQFLSSSAKVERFDPGKKDYNFASLRALIIAKQHSELRQALAEEADPNQSGDRGQYLIHVAATYGSVQAMKILLKAGADLSVRDQNGDTALHAAFDTLFPDRKLINYLIAQGSDVHALNRYDEKPIHKALMRGHTDLVRYADQYDIEINPITSLGLRLWDLVEHEDSAIHDLLKKRGETQSRLQGLLAEYGDDVQSLLQEMETRLIQVHPLSSHDLKTDFSAVQPLKKKPLQAGAAPQVLIAEYSLWSLGDLSHLYDTSRVGKGWNQALSGNQSKVRFIAANANLIEPGSDSWMQALYDGGMMAIARHPALASGDLIISRSIGDSGREADKRRAKYLSKQGYKLDYKTRKDFWRGVEPVVFNSVGNDHHHGDDFSEDSIFMKTRRAAYIGGAEVIEGAKEPDAPRWRMAYYSEDKPLFIMPSVHKGGHVYMGTSFHAPAAAALYATLKERHPALSYEELIFSIIATADQRLLGEDNVPLASQANSAGLKWHKRSGFGMADPQEADAFAASLAEIKTKIGADQNRSHRFEITQKGKQDRQTGDYHYQVTVPENMRLTSLSIDLSFLDKRSFAQIKLPDGTIQPVRVSTEGRGRADHLFGINLKKGEKITLVTKEPLQNIGLWEHISPFTRVPTEIVLRGVSPQGAIGRVLSAREELWLKSPPHRSLSAQQLAEIKVHIQQQTQKPKSPPPRRGFFPW